MLSRLRWALQYTMHSLLAVASVFLQGEPSVPCIGKCGAYSELYALMLDAAPVMARDRERMASIKSVRAESF